eukprot:TRINITY_DN4937_c0_g1_i1.p1 TRINITY_DN4937_c0_g1~~TRINITY_DN4937_c0_g1_i1.p1  ORF type:complete len:700 (-),score=73.78 TRINITY_DN4937_c0_g1_i1:349-2448(-)
MALLSTDSEEKSACFRRPRSGSWLHVLGPADMRFSQSEMELAYVQSLETEVVTWGFIGGTGAFCVTGIMSLWILLEQMAREDAPFAWHPLDPRTFMVSGWFLTTVLCGTFAVVATCRLRFESFQWFDFELGAVAMSLYGVMSATFLTLRFVPVLYGQEAGEVWGDRQAVAGGSTTMPLMVCGILSGTLTMVPIRCIYLWTIPLVTVICYFISVLCTGTLNFAVDVVILATCALFAFFAAKRNEANLREKFVAVYNGHQVTQEREAFSCLLEMTCECAIWIGEDGESICRSHRWLDFFMEQKMEGLSIYETLPAEGDQRQRLRQLLQVRAEGPACEEVQPVRLLQTQLTSHHSEVDVDLFVADRRQLRIGSWGQGLAFLVGIRCHADPGLLEMGGAGSKILQGAISCLAVEHRKEESVLEGAQGVQGPPYEDSKSDRSGTTDSVMTPGSNAATSHVVALLSKVVGLPSSAELLLCLEERLRPIPLRSVRIGDKVYCSSCGRDPVLMPATVEGISFLDSVECQEIGLGEHGVATETLQVVSSTGICLNLGRQKYRWMSSTSLKLDLPHTIMSVGLETAMYGFEAPTTRCCSISARPACAAIFLTLSDPAAPLVRLSGTHGRSSSRFLPVMQCEGLPEWMTSTPACTPRAPDTSPPPPADTSTHYPDTSYDDGASLLESSPEKPLDASCERSTTLSASRLAL